MSDPRESWWEEEFRSVTGEGIDFRSRDGKTVVDVQLSPQGIRGVYAGLMSLGLFLAKEASVKRACLIIDATRISKERLLREWHGISSVFAPQIAKRLSLIAIGKEETFIDPDDGYLLKMAKAFTKTSHFDSNDRLLNKAPKGSEQRRYFEVVKVLLIRWLLRDGPIAIGKLAETVGCSYPTVREALHQLDRIQYLKRHSNRTVELACFPHDAWRELTAISAQRKRSVQFIDASGHNTTPQLMFKNLERQHPPSVAIGGVAAAGLWHPEFDLHGMPRLDVVVHSPDGKTDFGFVRRLDPALKETDAVNALPSLVVHTVYRAESLFKIRKEKQLPLADPVEIALDLLEMGLTEQARRLLQHFRPESRIP